MARNVFVPVTVVAQLDVDKAVIMHKKGKQNDCFKQDFELIKTHAVAHLLGVQTLYRTKMTETNLKPYSNPDILLGVLKNYLAP